MSDSISNVRVSLRIKFRREKRKEPLSRYLNLMSEKFGGTVVVYE
jgi:hypothetical protein